MELRELRRRLYYELPVSEQIEYDGWLIQRTDIHLIANRNGAVRRFNVLQSYRKACDAVLTHIVESTTAAPPVRSVKGRKGDGHSQYRGVSYNSKGRRNPWFAQIYIGNNRMKFAGHYATEEEAARAYDAYVLEHGLDKPLNFPEEQRRLA